MKGELRDLYQQMVLDHYKHPKNQKELAQANREAEGHNPLCGDRIKLQAQVDESGVIQDLGFGCSGCAISTASASMMTEHLKGKSQQEFEALFAQFHRLVTEGPQGVDPNSLGKLTVFEGVSEFPMRVKCASLAWHTLKMALEQSGEEASTE